MTTCTLRLNSRLRFALYAAFSALFITGAVWLIADGLKDSSSGELWQETAADLLMLHGGGAMVTLMLLGALVPLHMQQGWRSKRNRVTGVAMVTFNATLIATSFGLYYLGSEGVRPWISNIHVSFGFALPAVIVVHVLVGRHGS